MQTLFWILIGVAAGYGIILLLMYFFQSKILFHPESEIVATPENIGLQYENVFFRSKDGIGLHGWFVPSDSSDVTVLYIHGNAGNISGRLDTIQLLHEIGVNVFIFDYRGYGKSGGRPTEKGVYGDAEAAWNYLINERKIPADHLVVMGRSLGGSIAAWLAARKNPIAAVIESTFISAAELGSDLYPWLPVGLLLEHEFNTFENLEKIEAPLFMAHSKDDQVVPYVHGESLFELVKEPKTFVELEGPHASGFLEVGDKYRKELETFLKTHTPLESKKSDTHENPVKRNKN